MSRKVALFALLIFLSISPKGDIKVFDTKVAGIKIGKLHASHYTRDNIDIYSLQSFVNRNYIFISESTWFYDGGGCC